MSALTERITEVQMTHSRRIDPNHPGYGNCRCGFPVDLPQDHAVHVAERIEAELQLKLAEEWFIPTFRDEKDNARGFQNFGTLEAAKKWADFWDPQPEIYSRWVSAWSEVDK